LTEKTKGNYAIVIKGNGEHGNNDPERDAEHLAAKVLTDLRGKRAQKPAADDYPGGRETTIL